MNDQELFEKVFESLSAKNSNLTKNRGLVYYAGEFKFNTDGYNLGYNLLRLTKLLEEVGEFL